MVVLKCAILWDFRGPGVGAVFRSLVRVGLPGGGQQFLGPSSRGPMPRCNEAQTCRAAFSTGG